MKTYPVLWAQLVENSELSNGKNPGCLAYIGNYTVTTQLCGDYFIRDIKDPVMKQPVFLNGKWFRPGSVARMMKNPKHFYQWKNRVWNTEDIFFTWWLFRAPGTNKGDSKLWMNFYPFWRNGGIFFGVPGNPQMMRPEMMSASLGPLRFAVYPVKPMKGLQLNNTYIPVFPWHQWKTWCAGSKHGVEAQRKIYLWRIRWWNYFGTKCIKKKSSRRSILLRKLTKFSLKINSWKMKFRNGPWFLGTNSFILRHGWNF